MGFSLRSLKPITLTLPLYLPECLTFHSKLPRSLKIGAAQYPSRKKPHTTDPKQFRPISLTSVVCKILETILKEKLLSHLSQLSLLTTRQHGFLPRRLTVTNLLSAEATDTRWFDEGDTVDIVYLDFAIVFDSVNHRLLLTKLKYHGIAPSVTNWIESYLRRCSFQVSANGSG